MLEDGIADDLLLFSPIGIFEVLGNKHGLDLFGVGLGLGGPILLMLVHHLIVSKILRLHHLQFFIHLQGFCMKFWLGVAKASQKRLILKFDGTK